MVCMFAPALCGLSPTLLALGLGPVEEPKTFALVGILKTIQLVAISNVKIPYMVQNKATLKPVRFPVFVFEKFDANFCGGKMARTSIGEPL
jgi:hypothetical protein